MFFCIVVHPKILNIYQYIQLCVLKDIKSPFNKHMNVVELGFRDSSG